MGIPKKTRTYKITYRRPRCKTEKHTIVTEKNLTGNISVLIFQGCVIESVLRGNDVPQIQEDKNNGYTKEN